ncbi:MAG: DUF885 family protein [Halobacteria archaeon]
MTEDDQRGDFSQFTDDGKEEFRKVTDEYLDDLLRRNPQVATVLGSHEYDEDIPSGTRESVEEEIDDAEDLYNKLEEFGFLEAELLQEAVEYDLYMLDDLRLWSKNPSTADAVISFIYPLYTRDFASLGERLESIAARLEDCPEYVEESMSLIDEPVEIYVENELEVCNQIPGFLQLIADTAGQMERQDVAYRINDAAEETLDAMEEYAEWLKSLNFEEDWRIGRERYSELLETRKLRDVDELRNLARREMDRAEEIMMEALDEFEGDNPREALDSIEEMTYEDFDEVLDGYVEDITDARTYTGEEFVELPENDGVEVIETPEHMSKLVPVDAYLQPAPLNKEETPLFVVTPDHRALPEHNPPEITGKAVGDFYPGRHLQQVYSCRTESSTHLLIDRFNNFGDDFTEGWSLYCQERAVEDGFAGKDLRIAYARSKLQAAARALVEIDLHVDRITVKQAVEFLIENAGLTEGEAANEVRVYTENPGQQVSGIAGYAGIREMRNETEMEEKEFHETLLRNGGLPVEFHRRVLQQR